MARTAVRDLLFLFALVAPRFVAPGFQPASFAFPSKYRRKSALSRSIPAAYASFWRCALISRASEMAKSLKNRGLQKCFGLWVIAMRLASSWPLRKSIEFKYLHI